MAATSRWKGHGSAHYAPRPDGFTPTGFGVAANPPCARSTTQTTLANTTHHDHHPSTLKPPKTPKLELVLHAVRSVLHCEHRDSAWRSATQTQPRVQSRVCTRARIPGAHGHARSPHRYHARRRPAHPEKLASTDVLRSVRSRRAPRV